MDTVQLFLAELLSAEAFERVRITGYTEILSFPTSLLSEQTRVEVSDALRWSTDRLTLVMNAITTANALIAHEYPSRLQQVARDEVIVELNDRLSTLQIAVHEFLSAPTGSINVSPEIAIN
jgi:hypothetical protein